MFTRTRLAAGSAVAGALVLGAVAATGLTPAAAPAYAGQSDTAAQVTQVTQVPPSPSPVPGPQTPGQRGPGQKGGRHGSSLTPEQRQALHDQYIARLATNLGTTPDRVTTALRQTRIDMINQAVQEGRLTRERADQMIQRINSGQQGGPGMRRTP